MEDIYTPWMSMFLYQCVSSSDNVKHEWAVRKIWLVVRSKILPANNLFLSLIYKSSSCFLTRDMFFQETASLVYL